MLPLATCSWILSIWEGPCSGSAFSGTSMISQSITVMTSPSLNADLAVIPFSVPVTCPGWSCDSSFISVSVYIVKLFNKHLSCLLADFSPRTLSPALSLQHTKQNTSRVKESAVYSLQQWCHCWRVKREGRVVWPLPLRCRDWLNEIICRAVIQIPPCLKSSLLIRLISADILFCKALQINNRLRHF